MFLIASDSRIMFNNSCKNMTQYITIGVAPMTRRLTDAQTACRLSRPGFSLLRFVPNFAQLMTAAVPSPPS